MAKCVEKDGRVLRMSDKEAAKLVKQGYKYIAKQAWKRQKASITRS